MSGLHQLLKDLQTRATYKYYQLRIDTQKNPCRIQFRESPYRILFVLSHMRSGSSLLTHILNSNPEIIGYGETHLNYESEKDFKALMFRVYWRLRDLNMNHTYLLDKVLHDHKFLNEDFLSSDKLYNIFLLREPKRTLESILDIKSHLTEEQAANYYINRLSHLEQYAKLINSKERSLLITYEQLLKKSDLVFAELQSFLKTQAGFSEKYQVLKTTGIRGIGDSSENIKAGKIIRKERQLDRQISPELTEKSIQAFNKSQSILSQYCRLIDF
jgi:hypothetical protein